MLANEECPPGVESGKEFRTTCWTLIRLAGAGVAASAGAREQICRSYWYPLYAYVRRTGHAPEEAQDLVQGFFASILANEELSDADRSRGRFRSFLIGALKHHISDERKRASAQKRGGGEIAIPLDTIAAESRYHLEPSSAATIEASFDREWAEELLGRVMAQLENHYRQRGRGELFAALRPHLGGAGLAASYADIGERLGLSTDTVKMAAHRLRQSFGRLLRDAVAATVQDETDVDDELRHLLRVISSND